ncbi:MAG TPA: hypothetical protein VNO52_06710 [Methylomirabilota bacterium]|nr:hypothetical protein [Methylomirabilota bacterium]
MFIRLRPYRSAACRAALIALVILLTVASAWLQSAGFHLSPVEAAGDNDKDKKDKKKDDPLQFLGPNKFAGRVRAIVVRSDDPTTVWVASATGGLWVSRDSGANWTQADDFMETLTFSSLIADPNDPDVMYAGSGEIHTFLHHIFQPGEPDTVAELEGLVLRSPHRGRGIFKTTDGGATWNLLPSTADNPDFHYVNRIAVHPDRTKSAIVLAATTTGLFRSPDGGATWARVVTPSGSRLFPGIVLDVQFHPASPIRAVAGTANNGAFRSTDEDGAVWARSTLLGGIGTAGTRIELAASASQPGTWLAAHITTSEEIRLLRSTDNGANFSFLNGQSAALSCTENNRLYTGALWVDRINPQRILVGGVNLCYSTDGGSNFTRYPDSSGTLHNDHHALAEDVTTSRNQGRAVVYVGNDGGVNRLGFDNSPTHVQLNNGLGIQQFVSAVKNPLSRDTVGGEVIVGGAQDIGTLRRAPDGTWTELMNPGAAGSDGIPVATDPTDSRYWYYGKTSLWARRSSDGAISQDCMVPRLGDGCDDAFLKDPSGGIRPPMMLDPANPNVLYLGSAKLWRTQRARTEDGQGIGMGQGWAAIKPATFEPGGPPCGPDGEVHVITAMAIPPSDVNQMWVGTGSKCDVNPTDPDRGQLAFRMNRQLWWTNQLQSLEDGEDGTNWDPVDISALPMRPISSLAISPRNSSEVYVAFAGWPSGGVSDSLWRIRRRADGTFEFTNVSPGLPPGPIHSVATHPLAGGLGSVASQTWVYAGTQFGLYLSRDSGASWSAVPVGLARVPISELSWGDNRTLVVATYGRGVWELDQPENAERVFAETVTYTFGSRVRGHVENLVRKNDGRSLVSLAQSVANPLRDTIRLELAGRAAPGTAVAGLTFVVESSVNNAATGPQLAIDLFNFTTGAFERVHSGPAATTDTIITVNPTQPARFVGPAREVRARLTWTWGITGFSVQSAIDRVFWRVTRLPG